MLAEQHLDPARIGAAMLCHGIGTGAFVAGHAVVKLSVELTRAINDYTIDRGRC